MIFLRYVLAVWTGFSGGILVAAGLFALITSLGIITRLAQVSHSARLLVFYENTVIAGTLIGNVFWLYMSMICSGNISGFGAGLLDTVYLGISGIMDRPWLHPWIAAFALLRDGIFGVLSGIYVGCIIGAIAEILDAFPIFFRRLSIRYAGSIIVLTLAFGKIAGILLQYFG